jgi:hypothetical protein
VQVGVEHRERFHGMNARRENNKTKQSKDHSQHVSHLFSVGLIAANAQHSRGDSGITHSLSRRAQFTKKIARHGARLDRFASLLYGVTCEIGVLTNEYDTPTMY